MFTFSLMDLSIIKGMETVSGPMGLEKLTAGTIIAAKLCMLLRQENNEAV